MPQHVQRVKHNIKAEVIHGTKLYCELNEILQAQREAKPYVFEGANPAIGALTECCGIETAMLSIYMVNHAHQFYVVVLFI